MKNPYTSLVVEKHVGIFTGRVIDKDDVIIYEGEEFNHFAGALNDAEWAKDKLFIAESGLVPLEHLL